MGKLLGALVIVVVLALVVTAAAITLWGVWGLLGVIALAIVGAFVIKHVAGMMIRKLFTAPFLAKGAVLRDASIAVHSVTPTTAPVYPEPRAEETDSSAEDEPDPDDPDEADAEYLEDEEDEDERSVPDSALAWYHVDATITPREPTGRGFTLWEPSELVLVGPEAKSAATLEEMEDADEDGGQVREVEIWREGAWGADEEGKYGGPQRVRLLIGLPQGMRRGRLRYYFEVFGDVIEFPEPAA